MTFETKGHIDNQPGLRGHSHDPVEDLMKQYVVVHVNPDTRHKNWMKSYDSIPHAMGDVNNRSYEQMFIVIDQFDENSIVFADYGYEKSDKEKFSKDVLPWTAAKALEGDL